MEGAQLRGPGAVADSPEHKDALMRRPTQPQKPRIMSRRYLLV